MIIKNNRITGSYIIINNKRVKFAARTVLFIIVYNIRLYNTMTVNILVYIDKVY